MSVQDTVLRHIEALREQAGPLLPILHAIHDELGHVPDDAVPLIAAGLNLSVAEVHGVLTFYHHFRRHAPAQRTVRICRAEACQSMQAGALIEHARRRLGIDFHGVTADGALALEPVYCLGNCGCAPAIMIGDELHGRVTPERFDELVGLADRAS